MDSKQLLRVKHEVVHTTASPGWHYIQQMAEDAVSTLERQAIDEEDDAKGTIYRREAKAARKFVTDFLHRIEAMKHVEASDTTSSDDTYELVME